MSASSHRPPRINQLSGSAGRKRKKEKEAKDNKTKRTLFDLGWKSRAQDLDYDTDSEDNQVI
jgi:hypothetical protein